MSSVQRAVLVLSLALLAWSVAGMIANPDFGTGDSVTTERVLGVDFNGWHALSGILLAVPGLLAAARERTAYVFALMAAVLLALSGFVALLEDSPAGVLTFPHGEADFVLHEGFAALYAGAALLGRRALVPHRM
jgi:hypothetical protein